MTQKLTPGGMLVDHEKVYVKGHCKLRVYDDKTGKPLYNEWQEFDNLIVTNGYALLASVLIGESIISHCGVGSGTTTPALDDSDLETPVGARKVITTKSRAGAIALFSTFFTSADNNGTWNEAILATALSGADTVVSHSLFANTFEKTNLKNCYYDWSIEMTPVV